MNDADRRTANADRQIRTDGVCTQSNSAVRGVLVSLGFWCCLLVSVLGYAAATLSVRYSENCRLMSEFTVGEAELRQLMEQVDRYEKYCDSLSRPTQDVPLMSESPQSAALDPGLSFRLDEPTSSTPAAPAELPAMVDLLNRSRLCRAALLAASAALVLFAFARLVDADGGDRRRPHRRPFLRGPIRRRLQRVGARYQRGSGPPSS